MNTKITIEKTRWSDLIVKLRDEFTIYGPHSDGKTQDYCLVTKDTIQDIEYNKPKPASPLKALFLPARENITNPVSSQQKRIIFGIPACDLSGLSILDEIYLDPEYPDPAYAQRRENTILIGTDCYSDNEHCHCTTYGFNPWPEENADIVLSGIDGNIVLSPETEKGKSFCDEYVKNGRTPEEKELKKIEELRQATRDIIEEKNKDLPDYAETGKLVGNSEEHPVWKNYCDTCISCGACSAICPTCSCFLLIEKPGFEKVRSIDTCQHPGFERVAAGEDPLRPLEKRFRNRYMCKYVWKPYKFNSKACTGCGRCIEACIGKINKNDIFRELKQNRTVEV